MNSQTQPSQETFCCPCCFGHEIDLFHRQNHVPTNSVVNLYTHNNAVDCRQGNISLGFCQDCGFIFNTEYDAGLTVYSSDCEESQGFSEVFSSFLNELAESIINKFDLHHKRILEIGCGKGDFLRLLCTLGENQGIGFDPAYNDNRNNQESLPRISIVKDYYSEKYEYVKADFICCRMTLEHIAHPFQLIHTIRRSIGKKTGTVAFFQVPDIHRILDQGAFEDIYYEHCSYFSPGSLARLFKRAGFEILDLQNAYDGQYILMESIAVEVARDKNLALENDLSWLRESVNAFGKKVHRHIDQWKQRLNALHADGKRVVVWGGGSKCVSFLTACDPTGIVKYVVDINPYRQNTFIAGTGQRIVPPEFLQNYNPGAVIIMNKVYKDEICQEMSRLGLSPEILNL
jgi:SAM-dependent methyltransferase